MVSLFNILSSMGNTEKRFGGYYGEKQFEIIIIEDTLFIKENKNEGEFETLEYIIS